MDDNTARIRDDDTLIEGDKTRETMGGMAVSTLYSDADLMALKINMSEGGDSRSHRVRWILREVLALRAARVARSQAKAAEVRAKTQAATERRRVKQRQRARQPNPHERRTGDP